jgi:hypothetical protein
MVRSHPLAKWQPDFRRIQIIPRTRNERIDQVSIAIDKVRATGGVSNHSGIAIKGCSRVIGANRAEYKFSMSMSTGEATAPIYGKIRHHHSSVLTENVNWYNF